MDPFATCPNFHSPRESERSIYRDDGTPEPTETAPCDFLTLLAESLTLTLQDAASRVARDLPWTYSQRGAADQRVAALERLIDDRRAVLHAIDSGFEVPRAVLERHGWLAVREAQLNVRDAPDTWPPDEAVRIAHAAARGASLLTLLGIAGAGLLI